MHCPSHWLSAMTPDGWRPGAGDNDFLGWLITGTYFAVAVLCVWSARNERRLLHRERHLGGPGERPGFWLVLMALLLLLGVNKQLDFQTWVIATGKRFAGAGGWSSRHGLFAAAVAVGALALTGAATLWALVRYIGQPWRRYLLAVVGLLYLGTFVVVRAGDFLPGVGEVYHRFPDATHIVLELGAILMIGAAAARALGRERRRSRAIETSEKFAAAAARWRRPKTSTRRKAA